jgi:hypothetical protein
MTNKPISLESAFETLCANGTTKASWQGMVNPTGRQVLDALLNAGSVSTCTYVATSLHKRFRHIFHHLCGMDLDSVVKMFTRARHYNFAVFLGRTVASKHRADKEKMNQVGQHLVQILDKVHGNNQNIIRAYGVIFGLRDKIVGNPDRSDSNYSAHDFFCDIDTADYVDSIIHKAIRSVEYIDGRTDVRPSEKVVPTYDDSSMDVTQICDPVPKTVIRTVEIIAPTPKRIPPPPPPPKKMISIPSDVPTSQPRKIPPPPPPPRKVVAPITTEIVQTLSVPPVLPQDLRGTITIIRDPDLVEDPTFNHKTSERITAVLDDLPPVDRSGAKRQLDRTLDGSEEEPDFTEPKRKCLSALVTDEN